MATRGGRPLRFIEPGRFFLIRYVAKTDNYRETPFNYELFAMTTLMFKNQH